MQLAVHQDDADILLKEKNILDQSVLDKYRTAGQITQTAFKYVVSLINDSYHLGKTQPYAIQDLCILGDSMLLKLLSRVYTNKDKVREKGISAPVSIEVNEFANGFSPELDDSTNYILQAGDIVTVSLGCHIDGYTASISHTVVIYPPGVEIDGQLKPEGPLLGSKADAIVASHFATEAVVALLGLALSPEKLAQLPIASEGKVNGKLIRQLVNAIAESFGCVVVPGSKVRRVRRFLAGQAEGIVAERDFKGVVWSETDQELAMLARGNSETALIVGADAKKLVDSSAVPTDDFDVTDDEVYVVDIKMTSVAGAHLVTLDEVDEFSGKNTKDEFNSKPSVFIRDFAVSHALKLNSARKLLQIIDKKFSVYPFKLAHTCESFPVDFDQDIPAQLAQIQKELKVHKLGLSEVHNRHLVRSKPIQVAKLVPWERIITTLNPTGKYGLDANKPTLPGMEVPLPNLGISQLKLKSLLRYGEDADAVARQAATVVLHSKANEVIRLTGGNDIVPPSWVHSNYSLDASIGELIGKLSDLTQDTRFGINIKVVQPLKVDGPVESMQMD